MMKIALSCRTELPLENLVCFDLHQDFGLAILSREEDRFWLVLNGHTTRAWASAEVKYICAVKWFAKNEVITWWAQAWEAALISDKDWTKLSIASPDQLFVSEENIFVSYDLLTDRSPSDPLYVPQMVCAFSRDGAFVTGLEDLMKAERCRDYFDGIDAGYPCGHCFVFSIFQPSYLWIMNAREKSFQRIHVPFSIVMLKVLAGNLERAFGIIDNRPTLREHPERPAFLYATFDLETGAAATHEFDEIETQLRAAGFDMETIRFQPNSVGKVIVSDRRRAALLDIVED